MLVIYYDGRAKRVASVVSVPRMFDTAGLADALTHEQRTLNLRAISPLEFMTSSSGVLNGMTTLLVAADRRPNISLNGDWRTIVDPYGTGLRTFHGQLRTDGYF